MEKLEKFQLALSATIISVGVLFSSLVFASKMQKNESITVTGSASKIVKSDSARMSFSLQANAKTQKEAFNRLKTQSPTVINYLVSKGMDKNSIEIKPVSGYNIYRTIANGYSTNEIIGYNASQNYEISSKDVDKIKEISSDIQSLVDKGITLEIYRPEFFYSDLASIKIDLLKEATQDAKQRATSMLSSANSKVGKVRQMRMGVFQITPPDSTMVSDMGVNDTSTINKKVTAVANIVFSVK